MGRGPISTVMC